MQPTDFAVRKLEFFIIFEEAFDPNQIFSVGEHDRVDVKITCPQFDDLDRKIFMTILNDGVKKLGNDKVTCRINTNTIMKKLVVVEAVLYERVRKFLGLKLDEHTDSVDSEYNFCSIKIVSANGVHEAYEVTFSHLGVLKKHFSDTFVGLLMNGVETGPLGAHKLLAEGQELNFINYQQAFDFGERELLPKKINYWIHHVTTNNLVFASELL